MALTKVGKDGIIGVSNSADATAITITSAEKVGIGVSSPQELLHIKDGSIVVGNGTASNSSSVGKIGFSTDSSNSRFIGIESFRGGDAANGDLRFHTFGGDSNSGERMKIDTAGIMTVLSEGRAVTTNVQQGLGKQWVRVSGAGMAVVDSFNTTSSTDAAQGKATIAIANDMANTSYACIFGGDDKQDGGGVFVCNIDQAVAQATTGYGMMNKKQTSGSMTLEDANQNMSCLVCGDLA